VLVIQIINLTEVLNQFLVLLTLMVDLLTVVKYLVNHNTLIILKLVLHVLNGLLQVNLVLGNTILVLFVKLIMKFTSVLVIKLTVYFLMKENVQTLLLKTVCLLIHYNLVILVSNILIVV
jgi:hypothetical protein